MVAGDEKSGRGVLDGRDMKSQRYIGTAATEAVSNSNSSVSKFSYPGRNVLFRACLIPANFPLRSSHTYQPFSIITVHRSDQQMHIQRWHTNIKTYMSLRVRVCE